MRTTTTAALLAALLALPVLAGAATITSAQDGDWDQTSTWSGGVVPGASDLANVQHVVTVAEDLTFAGQILVFGGEVIVPEAVEFTFNGQPTLTKCTMASGGVVTVRGKVLTGAGAADGSASTALFQGSAGTTLRLEGASLGFSTIAAIPLETTTTDSVRLYVEFSTVAPSNTTHVRLTTGRYAGAIWPLAYLDGDGLGGGLYGAVAQGYSAGGLVSPISSALDSVVVLDTALQPDDIQAVGATLLQEVDGSANTRFVGIVDKVFTSSLTNYTALFMDRDDQLEELGGGGSPNYILTRGVVPDQGIEFLRMAEIYGALSEPAFDNTNRGDPNAGATDCTFIQLDGDLDVDFGAFRWLGKGQGGPITSTLSGAGDWDIRDAFLGECLAQYFIDWNHETTNAVTLEDVFFFEARGPDNGDFGHAVSFEDGNAGGSVSINRTGAWNLKDDFIYVPSGGTVEIDSCFAVNALSGNYIDWGSGGGDLTFTSNTAWGLGENPIQLDDGDFGDILIRGNRFTNCGLAAGRNTIDDHDGSGPGLANCKGWGVVAFSVTVSNSITIEADTVRWAPQGIGTLQLQYPNQPDTLTFKDCVFENYATYVDAFPDSSLWSVGAISPGGWEISASNGGVIFDGCEFRNPWRRGFSPAGFNSRANLAMQIRGISPGQDVAIRNCLFTGAQSTLEEGSDAGAYFWVYTDDPDASLIEISGSTFADLQNPVALKGVPSAAGNIDQILDNVFFLNGGDPDYGIRYQRANATGAGGNFVRNKFIGLDPGTAGLVYVVEQSGNAPVTTWTDNVFRDRNGSISYLLGFSTVGDATASSGDSNAFLFEAGNGLTSVGGDGTYTSVAAWESAYGWTNTLTELQRILEAAGAGTGLGFGAHIGAPAPGFGQ